MKLVITNVAPGGPARSVTVDGRTYPVLGFAVADGGMTETYELDSGPSTANVVTAVVQGFYLDRAELAKAIRQQLGANRIPVTLPKGR